MAYFPNRDTVCSMAPKIDCPSASNISIRTTSPNFRNGVSGLPVIDGLDHPLLGQARPSDRTIAVRYRSGSNDRARGQRAGLGVVRDQLAEIELQIDSGIRLTDRLAVNVDHKRETEFAAVPRIAQFIGRDRDRRERRPRLAL